MTLSLCEEDGEQAFCAHEGWRRIGETAMNSSMSVWLKRFAKGLFRRCQSELPSRQHNGSQTWCLLATPQTMLIMSGSSLGLRVDSNNIIWRRLGARDSC